MQDRHALVVYATTSGATAEVAALIKATLRGYCTETCDLGAVLRGEDALPRRRFDLVIAGTPTYGKGDWHPAWRAAGSLVVPALRSASQVMIFGLGDHRGHPRTFARGLHVLHDFMSTSDVVTLIQPPPCHAATTGTQPVTTDPGLVIEFRRRRREAGAAIATWLSACGVLGDCRSGNPVSR